ncbi:TonB-linked outer membrane protein, SusC/RagA family [Xylanibacter ruminicola]|jgi:TonB-linked SusC/RagA family outer membrane protein|uniref:TonB-linked outer membrane protein, SusC/RagA family n=2 Tax=Bacteroidales TaxID=171549 RepID=A0A1H5T0T9_XYLRU|nr:MULTISPECIES: TonB-dependent receptor [Prevotellaceae]SEF56395.1 TonB-linked outer membrane protein, SusC/RagA family [Xylanibacter ruminicola]SEV96455.1 TonB-linked outer membrane protein, SusC/RagA family [Prevotella sp. khp7]
MSFKAKKTAMLVGLCFLGMITAQQASAATESVASVQQTKQATGQVSDSQGPLIGATVMEKGTNNGTVTDFEGNFSLNVKPGATLVISYVGYKPQEIKAGDNVRVNLKEDGHVVNEVVVIGYGTQRREAVTGSVANIGGEKLNQIAATNAAQALQGRVAGVLMTQTSSKPGAEMQIRIRGQRSLTASNDPLIVLDGIPFMGQLSDINPADIKSMDILKDASATAIYGSRGANGVIIITTVKGAQGTPAKVTYNGYVSFKKVFHKYPMMDGPTFSKMRQYAGLYQNSLDESETTNTDWQDLYYQTGISYNHDLSVAGGTNGGSYSFGAGYYKDESVVPTEGYDRVSIRGNFDQKVGKWFRFGLSTNNSYRKTQGVNNMYAVLGSSPLSSPYDENGNLKRYNALPADDQIVVTKETVERDKDIWLSENKGIGSYNTLFAELKCPWIEGLSYRVNVGLNFRSSKSGSFTGTGINNKDANAVNSGSVYENQTRNWAVENLLTFDRTFAEKHNLNVVAMYSAEQTTYEQSGASAQDIPADYFQYYALDKAIGQANLTGYNYWQSGLISWMGRVMYSYDNKYMISAALRSDASSRLAKGHQWHTYPAVSAGWNIARESFMEDLKWIDNLKLRVGYGETSNQSINPYSTLGGLATRNYNFGSTYKSGYYVNSLPNPELGWEYSKTWNFGLDFSFFNGRLSGSFEYYTQKTNDILLSVKLPDTSGVNSYTGNIGKTQNKGWEFSLNGIILDNKNGWNWEAGVNFYQNRNKLVELASGKDQDEANLWFVGHPIDVIYDYEYEGLWQEGDPYMNILEPGGNVGMIKVKYRGDASKGDFLEDGVTPSRQIGPDDRQIMSMEPDLIGGFNTTVGYKNFDLTVIGAFQVGGKLISAIHSSNGYLNMLSGRRNNLDVDYWTEENTGAKYPKPGGIMSSDNPKYGSTLGYFNAGYLKFRTITLGYNFDKLQAVKDLGISRLRVYATVQNPFVLFSPYNNESGLDPETNSWSNENTAVGYSFGSHRMPIVGYNTPSTRNFIFGVNVTF